MTALSQVNSVAPDAVRVVRIEVHPKPGHADPHAHGVFAQTRSVLDGLTRVQVARVYLIEAPEAPLDDAAVQRVADQLLADPVNQVSVIGASPVAGHGCLVEVHYQPGVMDPVAQSTRSAIVELFPQLNPDSIQVRTGFRYDFLFADADQAGARQAQVQALAERNLANKVIQDIHDQPFHPSQFPHGSAFTPSVRHIPLRDLDDDALVKMSREAHLFLSLDEMKAVQDYYRSVGREPTSIEVETIAQTWSEHCVHKTLKSRITYRQTGGLQSGLDPQNMAHRQGHTLNPDGSVTIDNLLKSTVAAATFKLMEDEFFRDWCVSVFKDNAGIVRFDEEDAVCIKVETHNHPSAIEPYGGAATGIGGCIRDVMGTGLSARPIANTDVFAVAYPQFPAENLPKGVIHPKRILQQVVGGVRDYGNRMGIPTINGAVVFHPDYLANPLVFAGCIGLIPLDKCFGQAQPGDHIIALGGRTGRDGIHGATFSSAELTDTHADEFAHAVQIGNAITQKQMMDVILQARDPQNSTTPLFNAITDCGAGGFSSAVGEMGKDLGAIVQLERAPLKYQGLSDTEIWISEAQERMVLAVPSQNVDRLKALCDAENVEFCDLGVFNSETPQDPTLVLRYGEMEVGRLSMRFLHDGIPTPTRQATWSPKQEGKKASRQEATRGAMIAGDATVADHLLALLSHPNIASKHWIIRQYDHEVQGGSVIKPLVGPGQDGPSDAAVLRPKLSSTRGIAIGSGLHIGLGEKYSLGQGDSYWMTLAGIDEAVRNVVCVGAQPAPATLAQRGQGGIAILDNFCWPRCEDPEHLGQLVRAAEACYDGAMAYRTPFVSGKDSLSNQFTTEDGQLITIPPTLLITALGIVPDVTRCLTMDAKASGNRLLIVGWTGSALGGSHYLDLTGDTTRDLSIPKVDLKLGPTQAQAVASLIAKGLIASAHDCSEGGLLVAAAEMAFAGRIGLDLDLDALPVQRELDDLSACFAESPSRYLLEVSPQNLDAVVRQLRQAQVPFGAIGQFAGHSRLTVRCAKHGRLLDASLDELRQAWRQTLDW